MREHDITAQDLLAGLRRSAADTADQTLRGYIGTRQPPEPGATP